VDEPSVLRLRMRDPDLEALSQRLGQAVQRSAFERSEARWRKLSFLTAALYCCCIILAVDSSIIDVAAACGAAACGFCAALPKFGRLRQTTPERS
jgi:shikimate kinase